MLIINQTQPMQRIATNVKTFWDGVLHLLLPDRCVICENELTKKEQILCSCCWSELPLTGFETSNEPTHLDRLFWGRVRVHSTYSLMYYRKNNFYKKVLYDLKYNYRPDIGKKMGEVLGDKLNQMKNFKSVDVILPVPLHRKKKKVRGYNQAQAIAEGVAKATGIPINEAIMERTMHNESQTKMSRFNRWENIKESFSVTAHVHNYNHILIVDDVITTGATLESIIRQIQEKSPYIRISIASLAVANK